MKLVLVLVSSFHCEYHKTAPYKPLAYTTSYKGLLSVPIFEESYIRGVSYLRGPYIRGGSYPRGLITGIRKTFRNER